MKSKNINNLKKCQQVNNLKAILNKANIESNNMEKKVIELQNIFKKIKIIINEKIQKTKKAESTNNKNEIRQQICNELKQIILYYKNKSSSNKIISKNSQYLKDIKENNNQLKILLNKLKYNKLQREKDLLIQTLQEKKDIFNYLNIIYEDGNDYNYFQENKDYYLLDNLYDVKIDNFKKYKPYKEFLKETKKYFVNNKNDIKEDCEVIISDIKNDVNKKNEKKEKIIAEQEFNCFIENNKYKHRYDLEIDLIDQINCSSESESESDESDSINDLDLDFNAEQSTKNKEMLNDENINVNNNEFVRKVKINEKVSITSSEKDTNEGDNETNTNLNLNLNNNNNSDSFNTNNKSLINKLVEIKEKYNKLMNEKYELEKEKNTKKNKVKKLKRTH